MSDRRSRRAEQNRTSQAAFRLRQKQQHEQIMERLTRMENENEALRKQSAARSCANCVRNTDAVQTLEVRVAALTAEMRAGLSMPRNSAVSTTTLGLTASSTVPPSSFLHMNLFGADSAIPEMLPLNRDEIPLQATAGRHTTPDIEPFRKALLALSSLSVRLVDKLMNLFLVLCVSEDMDAVKRTCLSYTKTFYRLLDSATPSDKAQVFVVLESCITAHQQCFGKRMQGITARKHASTIVNQDQQALLATAPEVINSFRESMRLIPSFKENFGIIDEFCVNLMLFRTDRDIEHETLFFNMADLFNQLFFLCQNSSDRARVIIAFFAPMNLVSLLFLIMLDFLAHQLMMKMDHYRLVAKEDILAAVEKVQKGLDPSDDDNGF
ncbi:hypothetical protein BJ741DRAFT_664222 [Chytriomyces cf. hyalinus JEL632]|nr:hypothetical protein BJ741DRAFT_664222 [Chytriomyces cf. hyalinus JEL632]